MFSLLSSTAAREAAEDTLDAFLARGRPAYWTSRNCLAVAAADALAKEDTIVETPVLKAPAEVLRMGEGLN